MELNCEQDNIVIVVVTSIFIQRQMKAFGGSNAAPVGLKRKIPSMSSQYEKKSGSSLTCVLWGTP